MVMHTAIQLVARLFSRSFDIQWARARLADKGINLPNYLQLPVA